MFNQHNFGDLQSFYPGIIFSHLSTLKHVNIQKSSSNQCNHNCIPIGCNYGNACNFVCNFWNFTLMN